MTPLNVLIVVMATLVGLLLLFWLLLRFALPWWLKRRIEALSTMPQPGIVARISLMPLAEPWRQPRTESLVAQFLAAGFEEIGRYSIPEMPDMRLWAGAHPRDGVAATIYDHVALPSYFDVLRMHEDESCCTITTSPVHDPANVPPGSRCIADATLIPGSALTLLRDQPASAAPVRVDALNFAPIFIELYARSIDHILSRPMPDAGAMREIGARVAEATGQPLPQLDDAQMATAVEIERSSRLVALEQAIVDRFLASGQIDAREWERVRDRVAVVHDLLSREDAAALACGRAEEDAMDAIDALVAAALAEPLSPFETFERINAALPAHRRARVLGEVDHPLYAQILLTA